MEKNMGLLGFGILFGFALSRTGASDYDLIAGMFTGQDYTLVGVMLTAIIVGAIGMQVLKKFARPVKNGEPLKISHKELKKWSIPGALLFGLGWGISGACPGTVLAQIGEGRLFGLFTFAGMICGTYIYARLKESNPEL